MVDLMNRTGQAVEWGEVPLDICAINERWASIGKFSPGLLLEREPKMRALASVMYVAWGDTSYQASDLLDLTGAVADFRKEAPRAVASIDALMRTASVAMSWSTMMAGPPSIGGQSVGPRGSVISGAWVNAWRQPAISLAGQTSAQSMPIGIQRVASFQEDELLLRLAQPVGSARIRLEQWSDLAPCS